MGLEDEKIRSYKPNLSREFTGGSDIEAGPTMASDTQAFITQPVKRNKSLVRPERERIDPSHRQYHYRQAAGQAPPDTVQPSTTGNLPSHVSAPGLNRRGTTKSNIAGGLRRGKSVLGRDEKPENEEDFEYQQETKHYWHSKLPSPWMSYCWILTFWIPAFVLRWCGIPNGLPQIAWREKIGLVGVIIFVMAFVAFLTFGFTEATCPSQPVTIHGTAVSPGYLVIKGWAYMMADWNGHPGVDGNTSTTGVNVLYPPINAAGMDASFLFPEHVSACDNTFIALQGIQPSYFPCQIFNPNNTVAPDVSQYTNRTNCHTSAASTGLLNQFNTQGVPAENGKYDARSRVYYNYEDVNATSHLMIYNGNVLNLELLKSLPTTYFGLQPNGLVNQLINNMDNWGGKDMTYTIQSYRTSNSSSIKWQEEAECLTQTIRVGQIDTISVGCMFSEIVLYASLAVILGVIGVKFILAVIFGWFLSWKLGNFKEESSYAARMEREAQIENWARDINDNGPVRHIVPPTSSSQQQNKRRTIFPSKSRFTRLEHGSTLFDSDKGSTPVWKTNRNSPNAFNNNTLGSNGSRPNSVLSQSMPMSTNGSYRQSTASFGNILNNNNAYRTQDVGSFSYDGHSSDSNSASNSNPNYTGPPCPFPLSPYVVPQPQPDWMPFNYPLAHTICIVTCYSEGEDGIRTTLDSICVSDYPKSHTMLLVICDGLITGSGETRSTPDVCVGMMRDLIVPAEQVQAQPYVAIADGSRRNNCAKVYAGFYRFNDETVPVEQQRRVPMITIVKCGGPEEENTPKPGNRGKRDSQIILMQFLQKVMFNERMTMMEYDFFNAIWRITGVPADSFEICLMVDADTKLFPDALSRLISAAVKDPEISGLCGETKIANKKDSWVTMIQVFEYYISHHQSKAFESIFGGVTCLPGCFCMYRIKAPKGPDGHWIPILANPDIVEHYSENVVDTLHRKNLLLLGEDRYLTTLMLRTFPNRKMMFVPQAVCKTVVPDSFKVLLSQRRRWINSTIHNLFELLLVNDLCGTFCFSMQFVVFIDLIGTLALPAAISFTMYIIVIAIMGRPAMMPLILLALILGLPAVLIGMTSRKLVYVGWMCIYLVSLPIWNFMLPAYAFWHFDDFSWGDTRKVEGVAKDKGHGEEGGQFDSSVITMKKWSEFEMERRTKLAEENRLPAPRFVERDISVDTFKGNEMLYDTATAKPQLSRKFSDESAGSASMPLTHNIIRQGGGEGSSNAITNNTPLGIIPTSQINEEYRNTPTHLAGNSSSDNNNSGSESFDIEDIMKSNYDRDNNNGTKSTMMTPESHELDWIQQSTQDNGWADPAPHHSHAAHLQDQDLDEFES